GQVAGPAARTPAVAAPAPADAEVVAHVQRTGDTVTQINEWVGTRGSRLWIEGFEIAPHNQLSPQDIEYQAVLGRGWLSPWVEGGKFCGSRGMALPLLGLKVRLKGAAATTHELSCNASFVDGSDVGPVPAGESCETESLAALESFQVLLRPKGGSSAAESGRVARPSRATASAPGPARKKAAVPARKASRR
ncbi:MAG: hypothetical protein M3Y41_19900, partial [Pseudomonadota bacterium]|nr:hypothetical protein [Pseudomonadota bacterium]